MGKACSSNGGKNGRLYFLVVEKPEGKRPLGRRRRCWGDLGEVCALDENWLEVVQEKILWRTFVTAGMNL